MFATIEKQPTKVDGIFAVDLQGKDCCPSNRCKSLNQGAVIAPTKMIAPSLTTWVEQQHGLPCDRIICLSAIVFMTVANDTRKSEILKCSFAALAAWLYMVKRKCTYIFGWVAAILAAAVGALKDHLSQLA